MKSKVKFLIVGIIIGIAVAVISLGAAYYFTLEDVEWREYIEAVLLPNAVTALGAAGAVAIGLRSMLSNVKEAAEKFGGATSLMKESIENNAKCAEEMQNNKFEMLSGKAEMLEGLLSLGEKREELLAFVNELGVVATSLSEVKEMLKIGFGNMDELVRKGSARKIMKVGDTSEEKKLEDTALSVAVGEPSCDSDSADNGVYSEQGQVLLGAEGDG